MVNFVSFLWMILDLLLLLHLAVRDYLLTELVENSVQHLDFCSIVIGILIHYLLVRENCGHFRRASLLSIGLLY